MDVLVFLAERAGDVVSHDELLTRFWRGRFSSSNAVHKCVAELRRALGTGTFKPDYIATVPKRGYRVVAPVVRPQRLEPEVTTRDSRPAIAVLPFVNMSSDPEQEFFSDGIAEDILNRLAQVPQLIVKARTSSFSFKGQNRDVRTIGNLLGVTHLLEGSVRKIANRVRITTQLIATAEDEHIWSAQFDRHLDDVFGVQDEISLAVLDALNLHLLRIEKPAPRKVDTKAYHQYLLGRHHNNHMDFASATCAFEQALALEPNYADACAALADILFLSTGTENVPVNSALPKVRELIGRALSLDPNHVVARQLRASIRFMIDREYQAALDECADIARSTPGVALDGYATILRVVDRSELALELAEHALELDPLSPLAHRNRGMFLRDLGRYEEAGESINQAKLLGLRVQNELATLALESGDVASLECQVADMRLHLGSEHWLYHTHAAALAYVKGDQRTAGQLLAQTESLDRYRSNFFKWTLSLSARNLEKALGYYADALRQHEHLAYTWSQGNVGMRRLFPWYYESRARTEMMREFGLDAESISRLRVVSLLPG